ncbi:tryptophan--tRNA ligase [Candidatus Nomurabacteria bacterium]|nr:tryptophan--tRNA ligase [Candidatus Nomurabacteria bacterium]
MKRLFTGLQSSGQLHIGNYFGALKPFADMYAGYESFLMVADYHSLTSLKDAAQVRTNTIEVVKAYIAAGVDPAKAIIFKQSDVPAHTELAWVLECQVTVPFLMQAHAYKDKVAKGLEANAGLFNYPMLMAADILLYDADVVPVGADQRQHVEYAREAAAKFNLAYGETLKEPQELIAEEVAVVPGTDGQKMSKSYKNTIPLFATPEETTAAVMSIVTDSSGERPENVYQIHKLFRQDIDGLYAENKGKYKVLKEALAADINTYLAPMREKFNSLTDQDVQKILSDGAAKAAPIASAKLVGVRQKVGVTL